MKKPVFFLIIISLALGGFLQGCDSPSSTPGPSPTDPHPEPSATIPPGLGPYSQIPETPDSSLPAQKILLILALDRSNSMTSCDPELKNTKAMTNILLQMLWQYYYQPNSYAPAPANAPDVLILDYPRSKNTLSPQEARPVTDDGLLQQIDTLTTTSDSGIFFAQMFKEINQAAIDAGKQGYTRVVSLVWTDGSFTLPGNNQAPQEEKYREDAQRAFGPLSQKVELGLFFPCALPGGDDGNFWSARQDESTQRTVEKANILFPLKDSFGNSWLRPLSSQAWFSYLFPGLSQNTARQKLIFYYDGAWHDFSSGSEIVVSSDIYPFSTFAASTGYAAGMASVDNASFTLRSMESMQKIPLTNPERRLWNNPILPVEGCVEHAWTLQLAPPPSSPLVFWWRGAYDLDNQLDVKIIPSLSFPASPGLNSPPLKVAWGARHAFFKKDSLLYFASAQELRAWRQCLQPVLALGTQQFSLGGSEPISNDNFLIWDIPVAQIEQLTGVRTFPPPQGELTGAFLLTYAGPDGVSRPASSATSAAFSIPVTYTSSVVPETADCQQPKQAGFGQSAESSTWPCTFAVFYASPAFHPGASPARVWFDYEKPNLCKAQDESTAVAFVNGFQEDDFRIWESARSADGIISMYQVSAGASCHPTVLHIDFGDGQWQSFALPIRAENTPLTPAP